MVLGVMWCCAWQSQTFWKKYFCPKNGENGWKVGQKWGFLIILENLVINFFWIWSIKKVYIICCIFAQIPYLRKMWFLRYGSKYSWTIKLQDFLTISLEETDEKARFFACWYLNKTWLKNFWVGMVKNGLRALKLAISQ